MSSSLILIPPALYGYSKTTDEVYYDMGQCLPEDMEYVIANSKLSEEFDIASTHMVLVNAQMPARDAPARMLDEMEQVDGVKYVARTGIRHRHAGCPRRSCRTASGASSRATAGSCLLINSEYKVASDAVNRADHQPESAS